MQLKDNRVLNITNDELLRSDKSGAQLLLEIAGYKPVLFSEQEVVSMELCHNNVPVLNMVTQV